MRALVVADIHGDLEALVKLRRSAEDKGYDRFFLLGDYSRDYKDEERNISDVKSILNMLSDYEVSAIPGNCDHSSVISIFEEGNASLHNRVLNLQGTAIIGFGGSNTTPFNTPLEYDEKVILDSLNNLHSMVQKGSKVILMAHAPPKDTGCDVIAAGIHVGSSAVRGYIESKKPDLVLCSHIHENGGVEDAIGGTRIVNIGRISEGRAYVLDIGETISLESYSA